jgi:hypothetical protein
VGKKRLWPASKYLPEIMNEIIGCLRITVPSRRYEERKVYKVLVGKPEGKETTWKTKT